MKITVSEKLLESILSLARNNHPSEIILLLRGRVESSFISIDDFLFPPLAISGISFAQFPIHMLPIDFSVIGTVHSHPSGDQSPSIADLNHFYGRVMLILAYPYCLERSAAFNARGEKIPIEVQDDKIK